MIGAVCHAPAVFKNVFIKPDQNIVGGREVTGFSNTEEDAVQLTNIVPFLLEDMLKQNNARYSRGGDDWAPHIVVDGKLITGQNPASSEALPRLCCRPCSKTDVPIGLAPASPILFPAVEHPVTTVTDHHPPQNADDNPNSDNPDAVTRKVISDASR